MTTTQASGWRLEFNNELISVSKLQDYIKKERSTKSTETEALLKESTRTLKNKLFTLQRYVENLQNSVDSFSGNPHVSLLNSFSGNPHVSLLDSFSGNLT